MRGPHDISVSYLRHCLRLPGWLCRHHPRVRVFRSGPRSERKQAFLQTLYTHTRTQRQKDVVLVPQSECARHAPVLTLKCTPPRARAHGAGRMRTQILQPLSYSVVRRQSVEIEVAISGAQVCNQSPMRARVQCFDSFRSGGLERTQFDSAQGQRDLEANVLVHC